jgi:hypothetical protein
MEFKLKEKNKIKRVMMENFPNVKMEKIKYTNSKKKYTLTKIMVT